MSGRSEQIMSLAGVVAPFKSHKNLSGLFRELLNNKMHGICFSAYVEGQVPGSQLTEDQIRRRMETIQPYTKWVRTFSCTEGNELIPKIAKEFGIKTLVGAWLGTSESKNAEEIKNLIEVANQGYADIVAVGNEVMYRDDLTEDELLVHIYQVKNKLKGIPVGYVDAYYEFEDRPRITEACDVILANCYPYWEGCRFDYSLIYMKDMYYRTQKVANGKRVIITETGWPSHGEEFYGAVPSMENALGYFINTQCWSIEEDIEIFYFSSFDEPWKTGDEGDVGAFWGVWDKDERLKF
jgi:exo-beta-1,3-glucanase (GH17 family)